MSGGAGWDRLSFMGSRLGGAMPTLDAAHADIGKELGSKVQPIVQEYVACLEKMKLKDGLRLAMKLSSAGATVDVQRRQTKKLRIVSLRVWHGATENGP
jgi:hypothetical protein